MTTDDLFVLIRDAYSAAMWSEDFPTLADLDDMDLSELDGLLNQLTVLRQSVDRLKGQTEEAVARTVGEGGAARVGDAVYRYKPKTTTKVLDPSALAAWLGDDWSHVVPLTPSTELRRGGVTAVCKQRGVDLSTFWETFTETTEGEPGVQRIPVDKAPKFLAALSDGEIRRAS